MSEIDLEKFARSRWGTDAEYFAELEKFHKEHDRADAIEYCNETRMPVRAIYHFKPYTVVSEHFSLMMELAKKSTQEKFMNEYQGEFLPKADEDDQAS